MKRALLVLTGLSLPMTAHAEYTSLIGTDFFDGVQADLVAAAGGIIGLGLIIFGLVVLYRVISR